MSRQIKFDAIYKPTGEHFTPNNINFNDNTVFGDFDGQKNDWCHFSLDGKKGDAIIREYTGLTDKNGKEIYEGDIVRDFDEGIISKIKFEDGMFLITDPIYDSEPLCEFDSCVEIIGNIYENPELLGGAKDE